MQLQFHFDHEKTKSEQCFSTQQQTNRKSRTRHWRQSNTRLASSRFCVISNPRVQVYPERCCLALCLLGVGFHGTGEVVKQVLEDGRAALVPQQLPVGNEILMIIITL
jgi:hypothetical protein